MSRSLILTAMAACLLALPALAQDVTPGYMPVPGTDTKIHVYGFAQFVASYDLNQAQGNQGGTTGATGSNPSAPTGQFYMSGQNSRFGFQTITSSSALGDIGTNVQVDFNQHSNIADTYGSNGAATMTHFRYGYLTVGNWMLGMADSLFSDPNAGLNAIDANGFPSTNWGEGRLPVVRYTAKLDAKNTLAVALEQNMNASNIGAGAPIANLQIITTNPVAGDTGYVAGPALQADQKFPSIVAAWTMEDSWGHVRLSAVEQYYGIKTNATPTLGAQSSSSWQPTVAFGFKVNLGKDNVSGVLYTGKGSGMYGYADNYSTFAIDTKDWKFAGETGYNLSYTHQWTDVYSSSVGFDGISISSDPASNVATQKALSTDTKSYLGAYVNLQAALTKTLSYGVEYKYETAKALGTNVLMDSNGNFNKNSVSESMLSMNMTATF
jgi:hypothetical protein